MLLLRNFMKSTFIALTIVLVTSVAISAEAVWPNNSAGDLSIFVTLQRYRIYADHCSASIPQLKPKFESLMEDLSSRIQGVSKVLLASDAFKGMKDKPVPAEIVFALRDILSDTEHNVESKDAAAICQKTMQSLSEMDEKSLGADLSVTLSGVQKMIGNLEKEDVR